MTSSASQQIYPLASTHNMKYLVELGRGGGLKDTHELKILSTSSFILGRKNPRFFSAEKSARSAAA
jgi:hypothetical protein